MNDTSFNKLLESAKETKQIMSGDIKPSRVFIKNPNPKIIRAKLKLTQNQFANFMNISVHTLRNWEQGRREPEGPAKVLLNIMNYHPEVMQEMAY